MIEKEVNPNEIEDFENSFIKLTLSGTGGVGVEVHYFPDELQVLAGLEFIKIVYTSEESSKKKKEIIKQIKDLLSELKKDNDGFGKNGSELKQ